MSALPCRIDTQNCKTLLNHFQLLLPGTLRVISRQEKAGKKFSASQFLWRGKHFTLTCESSPLQLCQAQSAYVS